MNGDHDDAAATEMRDCKLCGEHAATLKYERQAFPYGRGAEQVMLEATVPVWHCSSCGEGTVGSEGEVLRHEAVCRHLGRLTPREICEIRRQYRLTQEEFADLTRFGSASIKRWETGALIQNESADRFLRLLRFHDNYERLAGIERKPNSAPPERRFRTKISDGARQRALTFELQPMQKAA